MRRNTGGTKRSQTSAQRAPRSRGSGARGGGSGARGGGASSTRGGARRRADGDRTKALLMDVAEELFAAHGVEGVSVRAVNAAAGLAPASVHYHFGDRDGLLRRVVERRGAEMVAVQAGMLDQMASLRRRPRPEEAVRLLADPLFDLLRRQPVGGARWVALVAGLVASDDPRVYRIGFGPGSVQERINSSVAAAFPHEAPEAVAERWRIASTALLQLVAGSAEVLAQPDEVAARQRHDLIVGFVSSGLAGVCRTRRELPVRPKRIDSAHPKG